MRQLAGIKDTSMSFPKDDTLMERNVLDALQPFYHNTSVYPAIPLAKNGHYPFSSRIKAISYCFRKAEPLREIKSG